MYLHLTIKLVVGFIALFVATKFIGGRELRQLNVFDFISAIVLSELVGNVLYQDDVNALQMSFAILFWTMLIYVIDKITLKFGKTRKFLDGESELVIEDGIIDRMVLKKHRLELNEFLGMLREKDVFSIREVRFAFIEPDGNLSVIKGEKIEYGGGSLKDLPTPLIMDGRLIHKALFRIGKSEEWLRSELQKESIGEFQEVFYAEYLVGYGILVQTRTT